MTNAKYALGLIVFSAACELPAEPAEAEVVVLTNHITANQDKVVPMQFVKITFNAVEPERLLTELTWTYDYGTGSAEGSALNWLAPNYFLDSVRVDSVEIYARALYSDSKFYDNLSIVIPYIYDDIDSAHFENYAGYHYRLHSPQLWVINDDSSWNDLFEAVRNEGTHWAVTPTAPDWSEELFIGIFFGRDGSDCGDRMDLVDSVFVVQDTLYVLLGEKERHEIICWKEISPYDAITVSKSSLPPTLAAVRFLGNRCGTPDNQNEYCTTVSGSAGYQ